MEVNSIAYTTKPVLRGPLTDSRYGAELRERSGKVQVPYMIDPEKGVEMLESDDIIAHGKKHYS